MPDDTAQLSLANSIGSNILHKAKRESTANLKQGLVPNYLISGLASLGCSPQEISTLTKIPTDKLPKDLIAQGKAKLQHALRRAQIKAALKGNPAMLIWLGKALLNQRDQPDSQTSQHTNIVVTSDLLKNLQSSYHNTIADFRNSRNNLDSAGAHLASSHDSFASSKPDKGEHSEIPHHSYRSHPCYPACTCGSSSMLPRERSKRYPNPGQYECKRSRTRCSTHSV